MRSSQAHCDVGEPSRFALLGADKARTLRLRRGPEGGVENGPAAVRRPPDRLRIDLDMRPPTASPARTVRPRPDRRPILNATTSLLYARRCTRQGLKDSPTSPQK